LLSVDLETDGKKQWNIGSLYVKAATVISDIHCRVAFETDLF